MTASLQMTRRGLLTAASATAVLAMGQWPSYAAAAGIEDDAFLKLSQKLTGADELSDDIAAKMLQAFTAAGEGDPIAALANGEENAELANKIVAAWYSGVSPDPDSTEVVAYTDALMWDAMTYTKPMAYCGGAMGYWADAPAS